MQNPPALRFDLTQEQSAAIARHIASREIRHYFVANPTLETRNLSAYTLLT